MRHFLLIAALFLTACGFQPLHQNIKAGAGGTPLNQITVDSAHNGEANNKRAAFLISQALRERITDPETEPTYRLRYTPTVRRTPLGVGVDDVASRFDYNIYTSYRLTDANTGKLLKVGRIYSVATFGAPRDPYGRIIAEVSAAEQASQQAADRLITELALYFSEAQSDD